MRTLRLSLVGMVILVLLGGPTAAVGQSPTPTPVWSPASSADTALVDRMLAVWTQHDTASVPELYTDAAVVIMPDFTLNDLTWLREAIASNTNTYERVGGVNVATEPGPGGVKEIPEGSRYLVSPVSIHDDLFVIALEVDREGKIAITWLFSLQVPRPPRPSP